MVWRIEHFLSVVRHGSFSEASRIECLTQSALTKSVKHLEILLGVELFVRLPSGVTLTEAGNNFHKRALEIEASWNALLTEVKAQGDGLNGRIRIGAGPVFSTIYFPSMLTSLLDTFPDLEVDVSTGNGPDLFPKLRMGEILCYAGIVPDKKHGLGNEFETVALHEQTNAIYASHNHPLAKKRQINPNELLNHRWLTLYSALNANSDIEKYFNHNNLQKPKIALSAHSYQVAQNMLSTKSYIACLPVPLGQSFYEHGIRQLKLKDFSSPISTGLTYKKSVADFATIKHIRSSLLKLTNKKYT